MTRFYEFDPSNDDDSPTITIIINNPLVGISCFDVDNALFKVINDLQREFWRQERRESRHSVHIENIPDIYIPHERYVKSPEQVLMEHIESKEIADALDQIPKIQRRRFLLRYLLDYRIKDIASIEGCSTRAVKYSISLAKKNLRQILEST